MSVYAALRLCVSVDNSEEKHKLEMWRLELEKQHSIQHKEQQVIFAVVEAYAKHLKARQLVDLAQSSKDLTAEKLSLIQERHSMQVADDKELLRFQAELLKVEANFLTQQRELWATRAVFLQVVGEPPPASLEELTVYTRLEDREADRMSLLRQHPDLRAKYWQVRAGRHVLNGERGKLLPTVSFSASVTRQEEEVYLNNEDLETRALLLKANIPLFQKGLEYYQIQRARHQ